MSVENDVLDLLDELEEEEEEAEKLEQRSVAPTPAPPSTPRTVVADQRWGAQLLQQQLSARGPAPPLQQLSARGPAPPLQLHDLAVPARHHGREPLHLPLQLLTSVSPPAPTAIPGAHL